MLKNRMKFVAFESYFFLLYCRTVLVSVVQPSGLSLVLSYQLMESRVKTLNGDFGDYEETHQNDIQSMDSMMEFRFSMEI